MITRQLLSSLRARSYFTSVALVLSASISSAQANVPDIKGSIKIDGSSTVFPITEAVAEEFNKSFKDVQVTVGISGTGGGFKKFIAGETDISDASRPIKPAEMEAAAAKNISYIEVPVAYDAIAIVVNKKNTWVDSITVKELAKIWAPEAQGKVMKWSDVRAGWPDKPLVLFGAGTDSGTFDYFTEAVVGKEKASRGDYTSSEDDNVLVQGISGNEGALGYFGLAYYEGNKDQLKLVSVDDEKSDNGTGPVAANKENVIKGVYQPLARPLFIYIRKDALDRPEVREFAAFYVKNAPTLATEVGYVELPEAVSKLAAGRVEKKVAGSMFKAGHMVGVTLEQLLKMEQEG